MRQGEDIYLLSPKRQVAPPIELYGVRTDKRSLRACLGWPSIIDIHPLTARCPTADGQPQVCGEQSVCRDWPSADTFPVRTFGIPPVGATCECRPSAHVHGATTVEELRLAPFGALWPRTVQGAYYGSSALAARCRTDFVVGTVQHESSTVALTLQKDEEKSINFTLTVGGQGHEPNAVYNWRVLAPPHPFGAGQHYVDACYGGAPPAIELATLACAGC